MTRAFHAFSILAALSIWLAVFYSSASSSVPQPGNGIILLLPNGNETYYTGDTLVVKWEVAADAANKITGLVIEISFDDFLTSTPLGLVLPSSNAFARGDTSIVLTDSVFDENSLKTVALLGNSCKIDMHDYFAIEIVDRSDASFSIKEASLRPSPTDTAGGEERGLCGQGAILAFFPPVTAKFSRRRKGKK